MSFSNIKLLYQTEKLKRMNERLGNEEEAKRFQKLVKLLCAQVKPTITLLLVGGIDVIGNVFISFMYAAIDVSVEPSKNIYLKQFLMIPLVPLVYGLYMKKIRKRLPNCCTACQGQWNTCKSRVATLYQQP